MKRFRNRNKVNPPVIKEDSTEQRNISSPEDLQPALQHVAQPNVAAARKRGIGSRIVRGIRAAGLNMRGFFKPKKIVKKETEEPSGVNDVLSTRDRETAPRATTEDDHQTPTTQPSHGSSNSDIKGKSCEVMPKTSAIEDQPHTVIPGTIGTTTMKPSSPVPSNNTTKDWSHAVVPNTVAMKDQSNCVLLRNVDLWDWPDESCAVVTDTGVMKDQSCPVVSNTYTMKDQSSSVLLRNVDLWDCPDESCAVVTDTGVMKDQSCPVVSNTYTMKEQFRPIFNAIAMNKSAFWIPYKTYTTTEHNPSTPVPSNSSKKSISPTVVTKTGTMKDPSLPVPSNSTKKVRAHSVLAYTHDKRDWSCAVVVFKKVDNKLRVHTVLYKLDAMKSWSYAGLPNIGTWKDQSPALLPNAGAMKACSSTVLPFITDNTMNHKSSIPDLTKRLTVVTKTGTMKGQSHIKVFRTVDTKDQSNACAIKDQSLAALPNASAIKDQSFVVLPNAGAIKDQSLAALPNAGAIKDQSLVALPNAGAIQDQSLVALPNAGAIMDQSLAALPNAGAIKDQSLAALPNAGAIKDQSLAALPNAGAIKDQSLAALPNAGAIKDQSLAALPNASAIKDQSFVALPNAGAIKDQSLAALPNAGAIKDQSLAALPNAGAIKDQSLAALPNASAIKDQSFVALPNAGAIKDQSLAALPNAGAIKDQSLAVLPNAGAIKDQSLVALPNAGAIKDQSLAALPNAGAIKDQSLAALPNAGAIKDQSLAALPNAGAIKDQSLAALPNAVGMKDQPCSVAPITPDVMKDQYGLAMEKGFTFQKILGQGAFGKVMLASHPATSKMLAVKIVDMNYYPNPSLYLKETRLMKEVRDNPFIIHLYDSFQSKNQLFLVMEYLSGGDLFQLIKHSAPLPEDTLRNLTADIICGLEFLHSKNIVHRDIKPANILLDDVGRAKIVDLGESMKDVSEYRRIREFAGTLPYMAPEVLQKIPYYTMADYFSLGLIVYEMAVGKHPFWTGQKTAQEMLKAVRSKKVYISPHLNRHLRDLIDRLLDIEQVTRKIQVRNLRRHPFFKNFNWAKIQKGSPHPKIDFGSVKPEIDLGAVRRRRQDRTSITQIPGFSLSGW